VGVRGNDRILLPKRGRENSKKEFLKGKKSEGETLPVEGEEMGSGGLF